MHAHFSEMHQLGSGGYLDHLKHFLRPELPLPDRPQTNLVDGHGKLVVFKGNHHTGEESSVSETEAAEIYTD